MHNNKPVHVIQIAHVDPGLSGIIVSIYWNNTLECRLHRQANVANAIEKVCVWRERINAGHHGYDDYNSVGRKTHVEPHNWSTDNKTKGFFTRSKEHEIPLTASTAAAAKSFTLKTS